MRFAYSDRTARPRGSNTMSEKSASIIQKAQQERKRGQFDRALKRLEQGIAASPEELDLYLEAIDTAIEAGELAKATNLLRSVQEKFSKERERVQDFVREKLQTVHDPSLARCAVEFAVKQRNLEAALDMLSNVPDHTIRELLKRAATKAQSFKSAAHGGNGLRGETVVNELTNAVLSMRLGSMKESMSTLVGIVEEKPAEHKAIDAFLAALATHNPKAGLIRHARGCALRAGGNEIDAIHMFVDASRLESACAPAAAEQLRAMLASSHHPGKVRRALAETLLLKGDIDDAAQTLREYLAENPENTREVIMLLRPFIDPANGLNACTWLALEQALTFEQGALILDLMRPIQARGLGTELLPWLEAHKPTLPPAELTIFHASLALDAKQYEHAADMLDEVCTASPQDVPAVLTMIDRHRNADIAIDMLHRKYSRVEETTDAATSSGDDGFQTFEANEFRLGSSSGVPPRASAASPSSPPTQEKPKPRFNSSPFSSSENNDVLDRETAGKPMIERTELSLDDDGSVHHETDAFELTEEHVSNVAQKLYETGAAVFFHIDDESAGGQPTVATEAPASLASASVEIDASTVVTTPESVESDIVLASAASDPVESSTPAAEHGISEPVSDFANETFEQRYERFSRRELPNTAILALLEEAVEEGHVSELHELLYFEPQTIEEHFARYYYQAEYHILSNRPIQALEILAHLDTPDLQTAEKQRVWYKIAVAQRAMRNFEGANETLGRLVASFPDREEFVRLKRRNLEQSIEEQSLAAVTLEKTSSLD